MQISIGSREKQDFGPI